MRFTARLKVLSRQLLHAPDGGLAHFLNLYMEIVRLFCGSPDARTDDHRKKYE